MKTFKLVDAWINVGLIIFFLVSTIINDSMAQLFRAYFITGGWQVISMVVHELNGWFCRRNSIRRIYHLVSLTCIVTMPMGSFLILFFIAPLMAVFYTWLCLDEVYVKMKRPVSLI